MLPIYYTRSPFKAGATAYAHRSSLRFSGYYVHYIHIRNWMMMISTFFIRIFFISFAVDAGPEMYNK